MSLTASSKKDRKATSALCVFLGYIEPIYLERGRSLLTVCMPLVGGSLMSLRCSHLVSQVQFVSTHGRAVALLRKEKGLQSSEAELWRPFFKKRV